VNGSDACPGCRRQAGGELVRASQFQFTYAADAPQPISLIMPLADREFPMALCFAVMDMNLPEGSCWRSCASARQGPAHRDASFLP